MTEVKEGFRSILDRYADDDCLFPGKVCEFFRNSYCGNSDGAYKCLLQKLSELGIVRKVEGPLPLPPLAVFTTGVIKLTREDLDKAGYTLTEEL